jgi:UDP-N-acetylglucosamine/UDP-N-acetylgalactosamine diphosphorylase
MDHGALETQLAKFGQEQVLRFWDELNPSQQQVLAQEIQQVDLKQLAALVAGEDTSPDFKGLAANAKAPPAVRADGTGSAWSLESATQLGEQALREGRLAMILVAGGQGTRLGFDQPKSLFRIGPLSSRNLLEMHENRLSAIAKHYGVSIPLYIMTSPVTHRDTIDFLEANNWLGRSREDLHVFCQGVMPAIDRATGKILLESKDHLALSPDGHGGMVAALAKSGCLQNAAQRGIEHFYYAQIDNPLVAVCDPTMIGQHIMAGSDMTTQVVRKRHALERVGNVVTIGGRVHIIEYSDLPEDAARRTNEAGELELWAGNIAVHVLRRDFLEGALSNADRLPFHRAIKKVPFVDKSGKLVEPSQPNAVKFERFIFDLLPIAENAFVVEGLAQDVFAPVKNADGADSDTPELAKQALIAQHRCWLEAAGATVAPDVKVEIHPNWAFDAASVAAKVKPGMVVNRDTYFQ